MLRMQRAIEEAVLAEAMMAKLKRISVEDVHEAIKEINRFNDPAVHIPVAIRPPDYSGNWCDPWQEEKRRVDRLARLNETMRRVDDETD